MVDIVRPAHMTVLSECNFIQIGGCTWLWYWMRLFFFFHFCNCASRYSLFYCCDWITRWLRFRYVLDQAYSGFPGEMLRNIRFNLDVAWRRLSDWVCWSSRFFLFYFLFIFFLCDWCDFQRLKWISVVAPSDFLLLDSVLLLFPSSFYAPVAPVALPRRARFHRLQLFSLFSPFGRISRSFLSLSLVRLCILVAT